MRGEAGGGARMSFPFSELLFYLAKPQADHPLLVAGPVVACSRLRDGGGKSFSNKKCEKRAGADLGG